MLRDITCFKEIYIVCGYTDLRFGIESLAGIINRKFNRNIFVPDVLYLFCGQKADRFKGLVWEGDGFLLLYKRAAMGHFQWPRTPDECKNISLEQFHLLLDGFTIEPSIKKVNPTDII